MQVTVVVFVACEVGGNGTSNGALDASQHVIS